MGSNETAMAATGGPRVIAYLTGTGCHRDQIISFFCKAPGICETQENTSVDPVSGEPLYPKCTAENLACRCCDGQEAKSDGSCENFANACSNNPSIDCTDRPVTATCGFGNTCVPVEDGPCAVETITCSDARSDARSDASSDACADTAADADADAAADADSDAAADASASASNHIDAMIHPLAVCTYPPDITKGPPTKLRSPGTSCRTRTYASLTAHAV